jgi:hypothetical protein
VVRGDAIGRASAYNGAGATSMLPGQVIVPVSGSTLTPAKCPEGQRLDPRRLRPLKSTSATIPSAQLRRNR